MREPNFMMPKRWPGAHLLADVRAAHDPAREDADHLARDDHLAVAAIDPDLAPLVDGRGLVPVRGEEFPRRVVDAWSPSPTRECGSRARPSATGRC